MSMNSTALDRIEQCEIPLVENYRRRIILLEALIESWSLPSSFTRWAAYLTVVDLGFAVWVLPLSVLFVSHSFLRNLKLVSVLIPSSPHCSSSERQPPSCRKRDYLCFFTLPDYVLPGTVYASYLRADQQILESLFN